MTEKSKGPDRLGDGKTAKIVLSFQGELKSIKETQPELAARIDIFNNQAREKMQQIKDQITRFPDKHRELVSILVINGCHKMADEVFL